ncbi:MAG: phage baseplate assembly protein V [Burkholderiales bacterium]
MRQARVQISVPSVVGGSNAWARPCRPPGSTAMPQIGTSIWVMFEAGDTSRPVWMGSLA